MDYNRIIDLDNITCKECESLYENGNIVVELNDGHITNLIYEGK